MIVQGSLFKLYCYFLVCNAGYYKNGSDCVMCTGNTVKSTEGDGPSCPTVCDGMTKVPNSGHTVCGKSVNSFSVRCYQHKIINDSEGIFIQIILLLFSL